MTARETAAIDTELGAADATKNPRSVKRQGILRGAVGFMVPFITGLPVVVQGVIPGMSRPLLNLVG